MSTRKCNTAGFRYRSFQVEIQHFISELNNHKLTADKLLHRSEDIRLMYDDILKLHGQELLHYNGCRLAQLAQSDANETRTMANLADRTYKDSHAMRIATVIAMVYLPANLVLSFFSTSLVWYDGYGDQPSERNYVLRVHRETWIAILMTVILGACTYFTSWWWGRMRQKPELGQALP
ncbi:hypothetical protein PG984_013394 [Apiospora sp. TS-2023a]